MRNILVIFLFTILPLIGAGQTPVGSWSDHLVYNTANCIAVGTDQVYASTGSSILVYNKDFAELKKLSRINGLSETGISSIGWSEENKTLIIAYSSTNVDLLKNNIIYNIPDISRKYIPGRKVINRIRTNDKYAYLACSFGIVVIDIVKKEIYDTWKPGAGSETTDVLDIALGNSRIYAATDMGLYSADLSNPGLSYFGNWKLFDLLPGPQWKYTAVIFSGNKLYANQVDPLAGGDKVYVADNVVSLFSFIPSVSNKSFDTSASGFTISSSGSVKYYNSEGTLIKTITSYGWGTPDISQAQSDNGDIWIADINSGLIKGEGMSAFTSLSLPGPVSTSAYYITSSGGKTIICGGATDGSWNNQGRSMQVSIFENNKWEYIQSSTISDPLRAVQDPANPNHIFVSSWGGGLLEYENNILSKQYTESNSPLQTIIAGRPYVRICGMAFDKSKNLWITQTQVPGSIKVLRPDGTWIINPVTIDAPTIGDITITARGQKWVVLPRGYGLFYP